MADETQVDEGIALAAHLPEGTIHRCMADEIVRLRAELATARIEAANERARRQAVDAEYSVGEVDDLRAELADVRKVEAWIQAGNAPDLPEHSIAGLVNARYGAIVRWEGEETTVATGDSLAALGRALEGK